MTVDWANFTPWLSLGGGVLLGFAAVLLVSCNGRIAGISGILAGVLFNSGTERLWRLTFVCGLMLAPWLYRLVAGAPVMQFETGWSTLIIAGVLVGFGTRLGSGCTSGHGICGLSRFSLRSLVATLTFMAAGFITVFVVRHVFGG